MSKLIILITFVLSFAGLNNASGAVYKWSDTDGNIRFSDIPPDSKEARNVQEINISSANKMDSHTKKNLVEKIENKDIETELEQKTQDYKRVKNRRDDEDASEFLKKLKEDKASGNNTVDLNNINTPGNTPTTTSNTTSVPFGTATPDAKTNPSDTTSSPHSKLESNLESTSKLTSAKQNKLIKQAKNCAIAKANLQKLTQSDIILSKNNKLQKMTEEQLNLKTKETKANIAFYC